MSCVSQIDNTGCIDCENGLLNGFLNKEVILTDIPKFNSIAVSAKAEEYLRYKKNSDNFIFAEIVKSCCCNLFK